LNLDDLFVPNDKFIIIAGPCSVESRDQLMETAQAVAEAGAHILRGGAFKPRSSPYSFQGLGEEALEYLAEAREVTGLPIVTEAVGTAELDLVADIADIIQIGSRNMMNYPLLKLCAQKDKPVLLKRGFANTVEEYAQASEYLTAGGNKRVILCERGIRTFERATRFTLDLSAVPLLQIETGLPVIVDPSHATGDARLVPPLAKAALAMGADGIMVEVHPNPKKALCDGLQSLTLDDFAKLMTELKALAQFLGRRV
jgi:3-deoxy-7-phosphoheptulonate synthase